MGMKLTKEQVEYVDKNTNETKTIYNYKLWLDDEHYVLIKPVYKEDLSVLKFIAIKE